MKKKYLITLISTLLLGCNVEKKEIVIVPKEYEIHVLKEEDISENPYDYIDVDELPEEVMDYLNENLMVEIYLSEQISGKIAYATIIFDEGETNNYIVSKGLNLYFPQNIDSEKGIIILIHID